MSKKKLSLFFFLLITIFLIISSKYFFKSWTPYYQEKLNKPPRDLVIQALSYHKNDYPHKNALDLGAGVGNDTLFLLKNGWHVWANDKEQAAISIISQRKDVDPYRKNLTLIPGDFSVIPWQDLPKLDLIYAGYSLPFAQPEKFKDLWNNITNSLAPNGIIAAHFFAADHQGFNWWTQRKMSFFTKKELLNFFENFTIEFFEEINEKDTQGKIDHSFNIIARKI